MLGLETTAFGPFLGEMQTTDPTSLELALAGIITFLGYEILARPGHARRNEVPKSQPSAQSSATVETLTEERRVA